MLEIGRVTTGFYHRGATRTANSLFKWSEMKGSVGSQPMPNARSVAAANGVQLNDTKIRSISVELMKADWKPGLTHHVSDNIYYVSKGCFLIRALGSDLILRPSSL